ncbi:hypothetical protein ARMSODRAFT_1086837 [Armillaria solidipes]|uniref:F-box domain-containing protein n=1 Tax=Armillaria solidipes TaxID=1076256 RepID=A0A2H3BTH1_9AGAR|nr:hypothetical protein ARMSODRAFT_1086837 [Armillaria solidipes]
MVVSTRSTTRSSDCGTSTQDARARKGRSKRKRLASQSPQRSPSPSRPSTTFSDLPNELLHEILTELPPSVETTIALATTCRRLNEFTMVHHFGRVSYRNFSRNDGDRPFSSFRILRLSFIHKPRLSSIYCNFSDNFSKEMNEVQRSLAVLKAMGTDFHVSFMGMYWPKPPTEKHVAFFKDLSKLRCTTIDTHESHPGPGATIVTGVPARIELGLSCLTQLSTVTLTVHPTQYMAWMLQSMKESPVRVLTLCHFPNKTLNQITETTLSSLQIVTLLGCRVSFTVVTAFLKSHPRIKSLDTRAWNPLSRITPKRLKESERGLETSFKPATRLSLSSITGTATAIHWLLSSPKVFPFLERVDITDGDVTEMQDAVFQISHIPTVRHLRLHLEDLNEWLQFKFRRRRSDVKRAEELLTGITDFSISLDDQEVIRTVGIPTAAALIPNLEQFHTTSRCSEREQLNFVKKMKDACPGLKVVAVDSHRLYTDLEWLRQKEKELNDKEELLNSEGSESELVTT